MAQKMIDAIRAAGAAPSINHPNYGWAISADELLQLQRTRLFEVFNGHPLVNNLGGGGVPRFFADMDEDTIPLEAGIEDRAISFSKGCYVGQEVIVRVTTRGGGRVAKKLVRWVADASAEIVPLRDARIVSFDKDIGRVTSAAFSPTVNRVNGLGYVHRDFSVAGTEVTVVWNDARIKVTVQ
jgi:folate-binding protein YgfZ